MGVGLNAISGLPLTFYSFFHRLQWLEILFISMQICSFVSCGFLMDAFRLLQKVKQTNQTISKKLVTFLSIAYGACSIFVLVDSVTYYFMGISKVVLIFTYFQASLFFFSLLIMTRILNHLVKMMGAQQLQ